MAAMNKIQDKLFLGNIKSASDIEMLKKSNITHILQVASGIKPFFPNDITYKVINVLDNSNQSLLRHFPAAIAFIKDAIQRGGGVLVHCYAGVSRSATCVIAYLMQEKDMTFEQAFSYASKRRPVIFPNMGFQRQLTEFERLLLVKKQYSVPKSINKQIIHRLSNGFNLNPKQYNSINNSQQHTNRHNQSMNTNANSIDIQILKEVQKQINQKSNHYVQKNQKLMMNRTNEYNDDDFIDENPFEYNRPSHFERSASFGFNQDKLGRLNEINHSQVQAVLKGTHFSSFRRTNSNFNRPMFSKQKQITDSLNFTKQKTPNIISPKQQNFVMQQPPVKNTGSLSKLDSQNISQYQNGTDLAQSHNRTPQDKIYNSLSNDPYQFRKTTGYRNHNNVGVNIINQLTLKQHMDTLQSKNTQLKELQSNQIQKQQHQQYKNHTYNSISGQQDKFGNISIENRSLGLLPKISPKTIMTSQHQTVSQSKLSRR